MVSRILDLFKRGREEDEHAEVRNLASDYLDGELSEEESERVRAHREMCPPCNAFLNTLKSTIALLAATRRAKAPASFRNRLSEMIRKDGQG